MNVVSSVWAIVLIAVMSSLWNDPMSWHMLCLTILVQWVERTARGVVVESIAYRCLLFSLQCCTVPRWQLRRQRKVEVRLHSSGVAARVQCAIFVFRNHLRLLKIKLAVSYGPCAAAAQEMDSRSRLLFKFRSCVPSVRGFLMSLVNGIRSSGCTHA